MLNTASKKKASRAGFALRAVKQSYLLPSVVLAATGLMSVQSAMAMNVKAEAFIEAKDPWGMAAMKDGTFFLH